MQIVKNLGERWLWCDQLCIEQDNAAQKHSSIQNMDIIYRHSILTIVAFGTSKSSEQLPGIRPGSMSRRTYMERINGHQFVAYPEDLFTKQISQSVYESRAWTFSERLLSPRCLYITSDFIIYHCKNGHSDEAWEHVYHKMGRDLGEQNGTLFAQDLDIAMKPDWQGAQALYEDLVAVYTKRDLAFPSDRLNAFRAVLSTLDSRGLGGNLCGLPVLCFDTALLWKPLSVAGRLPERNPHFSSWSWAGWLGPVEFYPGYWEPGIGLADVQHSFQTKRKDIQQCSTPSTAEEPRGIDVIFFTTEFTTADNTSVRYEFSVFSEVDLSQNGKTVGSLQSSWAALASAVRKLFGKPFSMVKRNLDFIKLSTATYHNSLGDEERIMILLIGYPSEGLAERLAIGYFLRSFWESEPRMTKEITLG